MNESYASTDHVLGHELVHAFQFDMAQGGDTQLGDLMQLPLWIVEGMAEHFSVGPEDPQTAMFLRDALLRDDFPTVQQLTTDRGFFPYRWGHALWAYVAAEHGDRAVVDYFRQALEGSWPAAFETVFGASHEEISEEWREAAEDHYLPLMEDRTPPGEMGALLISPQVDGGSQNLAPSVSPDGEYVAFMSERDLFSIDLFLADARTGEVIQRLASADADDHTDALRFIDSAGAWSPNSERFAYVVFAGGRNEIVIVDVDGGDEAHRIEVDREIGEITNPGWSPDGESLVFSGQHRGASDLFLVEITSGEVTQLTDDRHAHLHPTFSPDGTKIAFASDRGPETDFHRLATSEMRLGLYHLEHDEIEVLQGFGNVRHSNPQFTPDGEGLYFLSDRDGFADIYRKEMESGELRRVTNVATGISGITDEVPAMSVAADAGTVVFSVFDGGEYHIYGLDAQEVEAEPVASVDTSDAEVVQARQLPPADPSVESQVAVYLDDPDFGLPETDVTELAEAESVDRSLGLEMIGPPTVGVGRDQFGGFIGGSIFATFGDIMGDRRLALALDAQGSLRDIGGQAFFENRRRRWNWVVGGGRLSNRFLQTGAVVDPQTGEQRLALREVRSAQSQALGVLSYPFSSTRRVEFSGGLNRLSVSVDQELMDGTRGAGGSGTTTGPSAGIEEPFSDAVNLGEASLAFVQDNASFGLTSPVRGSRHRLEVQQTAGSVGFTRLLADFRRYFNPRQELTVAVRGFHLGRYGLDAAEQETGLVQPLFLGNERFIRGYARRDLDPQLECQSPDCGEIGRLYGQRLATASAEVRVPLLGVEGFGLLDFGFLPTELALFTDAGVAWDTGDGASLTLSRSSAERIPVFSSGVAARMNLFNALILEAYWAQPWQRPDRGSHFGIQLSPGW